MNSDSTFTIVAVLALLLFVLSMVPLALDGLDSHYSTGTEISEP